MQSENPAFKINLIISCIEPNFVTNMSQNKGGRGSNCQSKSPIFLSQIKEGGEGRGSTTLGQSPKIYAFLF